MVPCSATEKRLFSGFTLVELMVVVMIAGVLAAVAVPSFTTLIAEMRQQAALSAVADAIDAARSEAITRGQTVVLCMSAGGDNCASGNAWESGFLIQASISQENYRIWPALGQGISIRTIGLSNSSRLLFAPDGTALEDGTFAVCNEAAEASGVIVGLSGMSRLAVDSSDDGEAIVQDHAGNNLGCPS